MRVKATFMGPIRRPWPEQYRWVNVEPDAKVEDLLKDLGYSAEEMKRIVISINGRRSNIQSLLSSEDELTFMLLAGGG